MILLANGLIALASLLPAAAALLALCLAQA